MSTASAPSRRSRTGNSREPTPAAPASRPGAILGLLLLTVFVLSIGSVAVRRMQISYGTET